MAKFQENQSIGAYRYSTHHKAGFSARHSVSLNEQIFVRREPDVISTNEYDVASVVLYRTLCDVVLQHQNTSYYNTTVKRYRIFSVLIHLFY